MTEEIAERVACEFWISLASLLQSYCALHGLSSNRQAVVERDGERISVRVLREGDERVLEFERSGWRVSWRRETGQSGEFELNEAGQLVFMIPRSQDRDLGHPEGREPEATEMDMAAEQWARELMQ